MSPRDVVSATAKRSADFFWASNQRLRYWLDHAQLPDSLVLVITAVFIGSGTGLGAVLFVWLIQQVQRAASYIAALVGNLPGLFLVMGVAGLVVGLIVSRWPHEIRGGGIPQVMEAVALRHGRIHPHFALSKMLASSITIGAGGSAGREGPMVKIGAAFGSAVGQILHFPINRLRILVACGAAAGVSAAFNAPIAGSIFALEVILGRFTTGNFGVVVISSVAADVVAQLFWGNQPAFLVPAYGFQPAELPIYALLGIFAAVIAILFMRILHRTTLLFDKWQIHPAWKTALGMLLTAAIGLLLPGREILGHGLNFIGTLIATDFSLSISFALALLLLKICATSLTLGAGNSGGVFAPSLFIGATFGGLVGSLVQMVWPQLAVDPGAFALVGMAAVFSGAARSPITAVLIIFEMSNDYQLIIPLLLATVLATLVADYLHSDSIYTQRLKAKGITLQRGRDLDLLQSLSVGEAMTLNPLLVPEDMSLPQLGKLLQQTHEHSFPVVDEQMKLVGMVSLGDYERALTKPDADQFLVKQFATKGRLLTAYPDETVSAVIRRLAVRGVKKMPVISRKEPDRVLGVIRRVDMVNAYNVALARRVSDQTEEDMMPLLRHGKLKFVEIEILPSMAAADKTVASLGPRLPYDCVLVSIQRYGSILIPHGDTVLEAGDVLNVFIRGDDIDKLRQCLR